jgi:hypothetical protein
VFLTFVPEEFELHFFISKRGSQYFLRICQARTGMEDFLHLRRHLVRQIFRLEAAPIWQETLRFASDSRQGCDRNCGDSRVRYEPEEQISEAPFCLATCRLAKCEPGPGMKWREPPIHKNREDIIDKRSGFNE